MGMLDGLTDAFTGGAGGLVSGVANAFLNERSAERAASENNYQAQQARDFSERMSNTAYQRSVRDMKTAGLNPMLNYMHSGGASTPQGTVAAAAPVAPQSGFSAGQVAKTQAEVELLRSQKNQVEVATHLDSLRGPGLWAQSLLASATAQDWDESVSEAAQRRRANMWSDSEKSNRSKWSPWNDGRVGDDQKSQWGRDVWGAELRKRIEDSRLAGAEATGSELENKFLTDTYRDRLLMTKQGRESEGLRLPGQRNQAEHDKTWFGENVTPFLRDIFGGGGAASGSASVIRDLGIGLRMRR
ncbi:MAG: DNA pilot protein [Microvirus sp.]|nr:MAG: DNA pilot protein [Microvirus sp.]